MSNSTQSDLSGDSHLTPSDNAEIAGILSELAEVFREDFVRIRRHIHQHPEASEQEYETTKYLAKELSSFGLVPKLSPTGRGLTCDFRHGSDQVKQVAIRGDMDALRMQCGHSQPYASQNPELTHACGHDAHATIVLGAMLLLQRLATDPRCRFSVRARAILQPAEETAKGALQMIEEGAIEGVDCAIAAHVDPTIAVGQIGVRRGVMTSGCEDFFIEFVGDPGHSSRPHLANDALFAATCFVNQLYATAPRCHDIRAPYVASVSSIHSGSDKAMNVIPGFAEVKGMLRSTQLEGQESLRAQMERLRRATEESHQVKVTLRYGPLCPPLHNADQISDALQRSGTRMLGAERVQQIDLPSMGGEDFGFYCRHLPCSMFRLGIAGDQLGHVALHNPNFDIDESALVVGASVLALAAIDLGGSSVF